jgi:hypothetical protein
MSDVSPSCITPPRVSSRTERAPHEFRVINRCTVVGESDRAGLHELTQFGKFLPLTVLTHAGNDIQIAIVCPRGLVLNKFDAGLRIEWRIGVRHAGDRSETARQGRGRARGNRLIFLAPRLAQVDVHVDQPRRNNLACGVNNAILAVR